ncbi:rhodanese-like domain-containing protein [Kiritimatiella glycovorans]|uniref:Molybdopterin biosynthesis protein MoeB n=1 Tax=Kiritimatiella glycovorans TaxID=1307763 RepID=A0A0G3ED14_9BACT|nr:rhodanese-like domain-containing protein [Kiritimatiella glycovorans]AKJ64346.1 molybdopterin biosynthesis protein MoeB [Kiritimatiella glycovorans]
MRKSTLNTITASAVALLLIGPAAGVYAGCGSCGGGEGHTHEEPEMKSCSSGKAACPSSKGECGTGGKACADKSEAKCAQSGPACEGGACKADYGRKGHQGQAEADVAKLNTAAMKAVVASGGAVILDARSGKYDDGLRLPGAKQLAPGSSRKVVARHIPNKQSLVVTYCSNLQCPASHKLARHLQKLGYENVVKYPQGIEGWIEAGGRVVE